jgi:hypothetical protein
MPAGARSAIVSRPSVGRVARWSRSPQTKTAPVNDDAARPAAAPLESPGSLQTEDGNDTVATAEPDSRCSSWYHSTRHTPGACRASRHPSRSDHAGEVRWEEFLYDLGVINHQ